ncbi:hypothetical protein RhiJN_20584 [Ceratobasidium sp. AG-Ba]|nr:hypothetical protein RhiJN_20584 [Ceratobasidium sp. AG-Ba]
MTMKEEHKIIRRYISLTSYASGGDQPSYTHIEKMMNAEPYSVIEAKRMPAGITVLRDVSQWRRPETSAWINHFLERQQGDLGKAFRWRLLTQRGKLVELPLSQTLIAPVSGARLAWTPLETGYAQEMNKESDTGHSEELAQTWLPPARTSHVYSAYSVDLYDSLVKLHSQHAEMLNLLQAVAEIEALGPIHCATGMSDNDGGNPHVPGSQSRSLSRQLTPARWLPAAFFDAGSPQHEALSAKVFLNWIRLKKPHIHSQSGTVYGGPLGVRVLVFSISRMLQNLSRAHHPEGIPEAHRVIFSKPENTVYLAEQVGLVMHAIEVLLGDISSSNSILNKSYTQRARSWESTILALTSGDNHPTHDEVSENEEGSSATSGVPRGRSTLREIATAIIERRRQENFDDYDDTSMVISDARLIAPDASAEVFNLALSDEETTSEEDMNEPTEQQDSVQMSSGSHNTSSSSMVDSSQSNNINIITKSVPVPETGAVQISDAEPALIRRRSGRKSAQRPEVAEAIRQSRKGRYERRL